MFEFVGAEPVDDDQIVSYLYLEQLLIELFEPSRHFLCRDRSIDVGEVMGEPVHEEVVEELAVGLVVGLVGGDGVDDLNRRMITMFWVVTWMRM